MPGLLKSEEEAFCYHFDSYRLCPRTRELTKDGKPIPVEPKVFDLLAYLVKNHDRAVEKTELQQAIWGGKPISETVLARSVMKARQAIDDSAGQQRYIRTIQAFGYGFVSEVTAEPVVTSPDAPDAIESSSDSHLQTSTPRWPLLPMICRLAMVVAAIALAIGGLDLYLSFVQEQQVPRTITLELTPVHTEQASVAPLGARLTMLLDRRLSRLPWLEVNGVSRVSTRRRSRADFALSTELRQVNSGYELLCTLRRQGGPAITMREAGRNPFSLADMVVRHVSTTTRSAALESSDDLENFGIDQGFLREATRVFIGNLQALPGIGYTR